MQQEIAEVTDSMKFSRHQVLVVFVCVIIFALGQFHRASGSVFSPILIERFALSSATIGILVSTMYLASIVVQVPFGWALDRYEPRIVLSMCIGLVAIGTLIFAIAASIESVFASRIMIGVGLAAMGPANHVIVARNFSRTDFGYVSGLVVTLGGFGGILGTFPLAYVLERVSWTVVFGTVAIINLFLVVLIFQAVRPDQGIEDEIEEESREVGFLELVKQREIQKILALAFVTFAPIVTVTGLWGGPYLQDVVGLDAESAGAVLLSLYVSTIVGAYAFGWMDRNFGSRYAIVMISAASSVTCCFLLATLDFQGPALPIVLLLAMVFSQQFYIPLGAHMRKIVPKKIDRSGFDTAIAGFCCCNPHYANRVWHGAGYRKRDGIDASAGIWPCLRRCGIDHPALYVDLLDLKKRQQLILEFIVRACRATHTRSWQGVKVASARQRRPEISASAVWT